MNLDNYFDFNMIKDKAKDIKKIFFYRICGTGMGAAACLLKEAGYEVAGADRMFYPPMSTYLDHSGIEVFKLDELDLQKLKNEYDLIVVGNVVARMSQEARDLEELGIPFCSFPAAIGALVLEDKKVVGLSGTHGKTTTTYFGVQVFEKLGANPGHLIGGVMGDRAPAAVGKGDFFFIESDEYDSAYFEKFSKFQSYSINELVITSLEYDHADIFESIDSIKKEFRAIIPKADTIIGCSDWDYIKDLKEEYPKSLWQDYGKETINILEKSELGTTFSIKHNEKEYLFKTNVIGLHNILNLTSIIMVALNADFTHDQIQQAIKDLKMVQRRQEIKGIFNKSVIIDDFAHHPTAVEETISAIATQYPGKKLNIYLEPGSATARSDLFQDKFVQSLLQADDITIISPTRATTAIGRSDLNVPQLIQDLKKSGKNAVAIESLDLLVDKIKSESDENSIQLIMSNSSCLGLWSSDFVKSL